MIRAELLLREPLFVSANRTLRFMKLHADQFDFMTHKTQDFEFVPPDLQYR